MNPESFTRKVTISLPLTTRAHPGESTRCAYEASRVCLHRAQRCRNGGAICLTDSSRFVHAREYATTTRPVVYLSDSFHDRGSAARLALVRDRGEDGFAREDHHWRNNGSGKEHHRAGARR